MARIQLEAEIKGLGRVHKLVAPIDEIAQESKNLRKRLITGRDLAFARVEAYNSLSQGKSSLYDRGSYILESPVYVPNEYTLLVRGSFSHALAPLLDLSLAGKAVKEHRAVKECPIDSTLYKEIANTDKNKKLERKRVLIEERNDFFEIPVTQIPTAPLTLWLFLDQAEKYAEILDKYGISSGIKSIPIYLSNRDKQKNPFVNQFWLGGFDDGSVLDGGNSYLCSDIQARWVLKEDTRRVSHLGKLDYPI